MRSYLPVLRLPPGGAEPTLRAKFGGVPWSVPPDRWPVCRECGRPMSSLAQIPVRDHLDGAGPLAGHADRAERVLHLFTCERPSVCTFWEPHGGANSAFFLDRAALRPSGAAVPDAPVLPEVWIAGWTAHDDPVPEAMAEDFVHPHRFYALPDALQTPHGFASRLRTKCGGVPYWTGNGPVCAPQPPFRYLLQIDVWLAVPEAPRGRVELANFCATGTGFLFVDPDEPDWPALFLINR